MAKGYMLTTLDNPFDPFVDFTQWFMYDCEKGHNTASRLARLVNINSEMTQKEVDEEMERAIDFIMKYDLEEKYIKIQENSEKITTEQTATVLNA